MRKPKYLRYRRFLTIAKALLTIIILILVIVGKIKTL